MIEQPHSAINLNTQIIKDLMQQTQDLLNLEAAGSEKHQALKALENALEKVLPYLPEPRIQQADENELENEIREEIVIAGANENG
jgi:hypothetical protein